MGMSETRCPRVVPVNTVAGASVKFHLSESMNLDPMSIHVHPAPLTAGGDWLPADDGSGEPGR